MIYTYKYIKFFDIMACSCKGGSASKQVTSVKQVVKKPIRTTSTSSKPLRTNVIKKRAIIKRSM